MSLSFDKLILNDNDGTKNIGDGICVEEDDFNGTENLGLLMDFEDNNHSMSPSTSRVRIRRVDGARKIKTCMNNSDKAEFYGIVEILRCKMVEGVK
ncbi:hypothetical protein J1N35_027001 [Gossypium stocksii]|uniref:Uncharacterized protein n=1 Tax=Gossypium stocksii TaxID=47602 RepID=A0A9D3ZZS2_9ROSI|nr:hypothetical protein J1N35_027001 [Gossypium stocksii]